MRRHDGIYATPAQESYLDHLWREVARYRTAKWPRSSRRLLRSDASLEIDMLRDAIARGKAETIERLRNLAD
jgi:hypothetical protein